MPTQKKLRFAYFPRVSWFLYPRAHILMASAPDVTQLLIHWSQGDEQALDRLLPLVYEQLRNVAHLRLTGERPDHTLGTTALVHEAYLKLVNLNEMQWRDRLHFLAMASRLMQRVLVDYARERKAARRGGGLHRVDLDQVHLLQDAQIDTILELDEALVRLEARHPRPAQAVKHRYFGGLSNAEIAEITGRSQATVERDFKLARAWLAREWGRDLHAFT